MSFTNNSKDGDEIEEWLELNWDSTWCDPSIFNDLLGWLRRFYDSMKIKASKEMENRMIETKQQRGTIENSVNFFSREMKSQLLKHLDRPGWKHESIAYFLNRLGEEVAELCNAIESNQPREIVIKESADVANFTMMIADVYRQRKSRQIK